MHQSMTVVALGEDNTIRARAGAVTTDLAWERLSVGERASLAAALHDDASADDHLMVAFYLLAQGKESAAREYLMKAGEMAPLIEESFK
jgi:hypothetical protein